MPARRVTGTSLTVSSDGAKRQDACRDIEREGRVKARPIGSCRGSYSRLAVTPRSRRNRPRRGGRALGRAQAVVGRPDGPAATRACAEPLVRTHKHEVQRLSSARPARPSPPRPPSRGRCQTPPREGDLATVRTDGPRGSVRPETKAAFRLKQPGVCEMRSRHRAARSPRLDGQQAVARGGRGGHYVKNPCHQGPNSLGAFASIHGRKKAQFSRY